MCEATGLQCHAVRDDARWYPRPRRGGRAVDCGGLENRWVQAPWVRIPPSPQHSSDPRVSPRSDHPYWALESAAGARRRSGAPSDLERRCGWCRGWRGRHDQGREVGRSAAAPTNSVASPSSGSAVSSSRRPDGCACALSRSCPRLFLPRFGEADGGATRVNDLLRPARSASILRIPRGFPSGSRTIPGWSTGRCPLRGPSP